MRRVAIIGLGRTQNERPEGWETWGLPWDGYAPRYDRLFEMHHDWERRKERLKEVGVPIWMQKEHDDFPSIAYPLWAVISTVGDYFGSSVAYMIALAIYENVDEIGLWGVDLHEDAYEHQRPNVEYLLGIAHGRGIGIRIPNGSALLKSSGRYGYL